MHYITVGVMGNFCGSECLESYRTTYQKQTEQKAYQNLCKLIYAMNRVILSEQPSEKDIMFIKKIEASVLNMKDWVKHLSEVEE
jgi:hypothetical protein